MSGTPENLPHAHESQTLSELEAQAAWLRLGRLMPSVDYAPADTIVIEQEDGTWTVPLRSPIDYVDDNDLKFMTTDRPDVHVSKPGIMNSYSEPTVEVAHYGTDDEVRRSEVLVGQKYFMPRQS